MMAWKKVCCKGLVFLVIFSLLLLGVQEILRHKGEHDEDVKARFDSYARQINSGMDIDVVYLGSSPVYVSLAPMVMYHQYGYTGMNFGTSTQTAMAVYHSLSYILEFGTPRVVVVDFGDLCQERLANHDKYYYAYRKATDSMSWTKTKVQFLKDIVNTTGSIEYLFPIWRQHSRWANISRSDVGLYRSKYSEYSKGVYLSSKHEEQTLTAPYDATLTPLVPSEISKTYYDKFISLCKEKGIRIIGCTMPVANLDEEMAGQNAIAAYCKENDIPYYNYNDPALVAEIGLDYERDFYNKDHLNRGGAIKLTASFAKKLNALCDLPDHRGDAAYAEWEKDWQAFYAENTDLLQEKVG